MTGAIIKCSIHNFYYYYKLRLWLPVQDTVFNNTHSSIRVFLVNRRRRVIARRNYSDIFSGSFFRDSLRENDSESDFCSWHLK